MSSFSSVLRAKATNSGNLAPYYVLFHMIFAYVVLSTRPAKSYLKIDHNVSPRHDITEYAQRKVKDGKMTPRQLKFLQRNQACHENSVEHFPVFVAATIFATVAGIDVSRINYACAGYTAARVVYAISYLTIENHRLSYIRSLAWWGGNIACINLFWAAGKAFNQK